MHTVYVNLDRETERRQWMDQQANLLGLTIERVPAVDGTSLAQSEIKAVTSKSRKAISPGAIGCFLSHRAVWGAMLQGEHSHVAIFEDDVRISPAAKLFLTDSSWIPADADIVRLEKKQGKPVAGTTSIPVHDRHLRRLYGKDAGAAGYIISRNCAVILLARLTRLTEEFDQMLFNRRSPICRSLRIYKLYPSLCVQDQKRFQSSIERMKFLPRFAQNIANTTQRGMDRLRAPEPADRYVAEFR